MDIQGGGRSRAASEESGQVLQDRKIFVNRIDAGVRSPDRKAPLDRKHVSEQVSAPAAAAVPVEAAEPAVPFVSVLERYQHQQSLIAQNKPLTQRNVQAASEPVPSPSPSDPVDPSDKKMSAEAELRLDNKRTAEKSYNKFQKTVRKYCAAPALRDSLLQAFQGETLNLSLLTKSAKAGAKSRPPTSAQILVSLPDQVTKAMTAHARGVGITSLTLPENLHALPNFTPDLPPLKHLSVPRFQGKVFDLSKFPASPPNIHLQLGNIPHTQIIRCYRSARIEAILQPQQPVLMEILDRDQADLGLPLTETVRNSSSLARRLPRGRWHTQRNYAGEREYVRKHGFAAVQNINHNSQLHFGIYAPDARKDEAVVCRHLAIQQLWRISNGAEISGQSPDAVNPVSEDIYGLLKFKSPAIQIIDLADFGNSIAQHLSQARPGATPTLFACITDHHVLTLMVEQLKPIESKAEDSSVEGLPGYQVTVYDPNRTYKPEVRLYRDLGAVKDARLEDFIPDGYVDKYYFNDSDCAGLPGYDPTGIPQRAWTMIPFPDTSSWRSLDEMRAGLEAQWPVARSSAVAPKLDTRSSQVHPGRLWHLARAGRAKALADALQAIDWSKLSHAEAFAGLYGPAYNKGHLLALALEINEPLSEVIVGCVSSSELPAAEQERLLSSPNKFGYAPFALAVRRGRARFAQHLVTQLKALNIPAERLITLLGAGCPSGSLLQERVIDADTRGLKIFFDAIHASGLPEVDRAVLASGLHEKSNALFHCSWPCSLNKLKPYPLWRYCSMNIWIQSVGQPKGAWTSCALISRPDWVSSPLHSKRDTTKWRLPICTWWVIPLASRHWTKLICFEQCDPMVYPVCMLRC